jgi:hypothetical protein
MSAILFEQTPGQLVASGERTVATFESGLVRVDQTYTCSHASAATHRSTLAIGASLPDGDSTPAIDGLYIFPAPQEIKRSDGFTDFKVSAYGRVKSDLQNILVEQQRAANDTFRYSVWKVSGTICIPANTSLVIEDLNLDPVLFEPFNVVILSNPVFDTLSVTEIEVVSPRFRPPNVTVTLPSGSYEVSAPSVTRRNYRIEMTLDGETAGLVTTMWLADPRISITATRGFGSFVELDITTEREAAEAVIE